MARIDPKLMLRLPDDLKTRVQDAAAHANQSMNSLIVAMLEREFPRPSIDLHNLAAFLNGLSSEAFDAADEDRPCEYLDEVNRGLATVKSPWSVKVHGTGDITFYPYADPPKHEKDG